MVVIENTTTQTQQHKHTDTHTHTKTKWTDERNTPFFMPLLVGIGERGLLERGSFQDVDFADILESWYR